MDEHIDHIDQAGANGGTDEQFTQFVSARAPALQRTAYLLTGDWGLAEDLIQTALARAYLRWSRIRRDDPEGYVRKVLINTYASWWRRKWRGERPTGQVPDRVAIDSVSTVDDRVSLAAALARLPARQRATIVLRFHEDLTESTVAAILNCSIGTVKSQTAKALAKLRADPTLGAFEAGRKSGRAMGAGQESATAALPMAASTTAPVTNGA